MTKKITNFALNPDENTLRQFDSCCSENFVLSASLMPDAHSGYVAPIGSVLVTRDVVVPAWVGYDIGCGMICCKISAKNIKEKIQNNSNEIFSKVNEKIPMGVGKIGVHGDVSESIRTQFRELLNNFKQKEYSEEIYKFLKTQAEAHIGSLGSGNHFIELGRYFEEKEISEETQNSQTPSSYSDSLFLVVHSGSRGVGHTIGEYYMKKASGENKAHEKTYSLSVTSRNGKEYLNALDFCLEFALLNRLEIATRVKEVIEEVLNESIEMKLWVNKNHNHALEIEKGDLGMGERESQLFIHRKGATPAQKGERGVIPANMRDGSFLVEGLGNKDFLYSSSHGAGRIMSRREAKRKVTIDDFENSMTGIVGNTDESIIDEAPDAYKNIYDVMEQQKTSVKILAQIKPLINWKK